MKTSIFNKLLCAAIASCFLMGCKESSFLDEQNPNTNTEQNFWKTEADANSAMATIYSPIRGQMYGYFGAFTGFQNMNVRGDDVWAVPNDDPQTWDITIFQNNPNTDRYDWGRMYSSISRANTFLANIDRVSMDETRKNYLKGEALFLRGFNYFLLVTNFGQGPLRLKPIETTGEAMAPSVSEEELWKQVESDLQEAKKMLPATRPSEQTGRVLQGAAVAYLGKAYMYQKKYKEAEVELATLIKSNIYDLVEYEDNFTPKNEFNKESIFELNYAGFGSSGAWGDEESNSIQGMVLPNFIGSPATGGWFKMMPSGYIIEEFIKEERPDGSDSRFDKRMYTNFFFKYSDYADTKPDEKWYGGRFDMDALWKSTEGKRQNNPPVFPKINGKEGRFLPKKYTAFYLNKDNGDSMYNPEPIDNNFRVMRFAEVLLLHAEAAVEVGKMGEAANDVNRIRNRAGLPNKTWSGKDDLLKEIEHQNLLEFWFEGKRFFDLKRTYGFDQMKKIFVDHKKQGAASFQAKHYVFPVPQGEINTNTLIVQHPLWR